MDLVGIEDTLVDEDECNSEPHEADEETSQLS